MITADQVKKLRLDFCAHINYGGGSHGYSYRSIDFPSVTVTRFTPKRTKKDPNPKRVSRIYVGELEVPWGDWQAVADLLNGIPRKCIHDNCAVEVTRFCDWKVKERPSGTCDKPMCAFHAHSPAGFDDKDLCPEHAAEWKRRQARKAAP